MKFNKPFSFGTKTGSLRSMALTWVGAAAILSSIVAEAATPAELGAFVGSYRLQAGNGICRAAVSVMLGKENNTLEATFVDRNAMGSYFSFSHIDEGPIQDLQRSSEGGVSLKVTSSSAYNPNTLTLSNTYTFRGVVMAVVPRWGTQTTLVSRTPSGNRLHVVMTGFSSDNGDCYYIRSN